jgi:cation transport regulator
VPYRAITDLPASVREHLPEHAQQIYRSAFNYAHAAYAGESDREVHAHTIAWAAVKRSYVKEGATWVLKEPSSAPSSSAGFRQNGDVVHGR